MMALELSVVIPTYDRIGTLRHVVPSLLRQTLPQDRYEIVVADSNSTDGTAELLAEIARDHPNVRHLPAEYGGRAAARNAGISAARGEVVLFTDADIVATEDLLERHLAHHRERKKIAVVGKELQVPSIEAYEHLRDHPEERAPLHPDTRKRLSWLYFMTGNASVRKADLDRVGRFDEAFTGYGHEDLELGYRLESAGITIVYEPEAIDYHCQDVPYAEQKEKMVLAGRSTVRFWRKHQTLVVRARLGMLPVSLWWYHRLAKLPAVLGWLERRAARAPGSAREIVYQFHYLRGVSAALRGSDRG